MNLASLIARTRSLLRDLNNSTFRQIDIEMYINESIDRVRMVIPELINMKQLDNDLDVPIIMPEHYHHLLAVYSAARCYFQDERNFQGTTLMNEFEEKLFSLKMSITNGETILYDEENLPIDVAYVEEYVKNVYFKIKT